MTDGVSWQCDTGYHGRCAECECACHRPNVTGAGETGRVLDDEIK